MLLTVAIPTFRRPDMLGQCLDSLVPQLCDEVEILVVDNDPAGSARATVQRYGQPALRYAHEPRPGVVHARNRAAADSRGRYLAFIDDDEIADAKWIEALIHHAKMGVAASFGIVSARFLGPVEPALRPLLERLYTRDLQRPADADVSDEWIHVGTGNSLFDKQACFIGPEPFSGRFNGTGGEDVWFARSLVERGLTLRWNPAAVVIEQVPPDRATIDYLHSRRFRQGQQRTVLMRGAGGLAGSARALMWMGIGTVQWSLHGVRAGALKALGRPGWRAASVQASGGLGKLLWWRLWDTTPYAGGQ